MAQPVNSRINLGLPQFPEGTPKELFSAFFTVYNALQNLSRQISQFSGIDGQDSEAWSQLTVDDTVWQINPGRWYVRQYEAVSFGQAVSPFLDGSELKVRLANATNNTRPCCGIVSSTNHVSAIGSFCEVTVGQALITGVSGMIAGRPYFLSTTNGVLTNAAPVAAGNIEQYVGWAMASNRLLMDVPMRWIQH